MNTDSSKRTRKAWTQDDIVSLTKAFYVDNGGEKAAHAMFDRKYGKDAVTRKMIERSFIEKPPPEDLSDTARERVRTFVSQIGKMPEKQRRLFLRALNTDLREAGLVGKKADAESEEVPA